MADTPLHYRLTNEEWLKAVRELTESQKDVLYYLRTLDPYGDRKLEIGVRELAKTLGLDPSTVSRALKALDEKGYIDLEIVQARIKLNSKVLHQNSSVAPEQQCCTRTTVLHQNNNDDRHATTTIATQQPRSPRNDRPPEPAQDNDSGPFKTDQTDQTYLNSLSNVPPPTLEREFDDEELIEWVSRQNNQARNPRAYAIKCIKSNKKYWQSKYQEYLNRTNIPPQIIQENENLSEAERPSEEESVLGRLQCLWALPRKRQECIRRVEEHPEWGIKIDPDRGPVRVEEPVQAEAEAEDTAERFSPLGKILESMKLQQVEEPVDLGDLITMIGIHLKRLGMSKVEAIARMIHHGWPATHPAILTRNLSVCSADDLLDLQEVLEGL